MEVKNFIFSRTRKFLAGRVAAYGLAFSLGFGSFAIGCAGKQEIKTYELPERERQQINTYETPQRYEIPKSEIPCDTVSRAYYQGSKVEIERDSGEYEWDFPFAKVKHILFYIDKGICVMQVFYEKLDGAVEKKMLYLHDE